MAAVGVSSTLLATRQEPLQRVGRNARVAELARGTRSRREAFNGIPIALGALADGGQSSRLPHPRESL